MKLMWRQACAPVAAMLAVVVLRPGFAQERYDVVIRNGRVMDLETGLDAIRDLGVRGS